jgi:hypothetical protein
MSSSQGARRERPLAEQHEEWTAHLRRQVMSRRNVIRGSIGAAAGSMVLGPGLWSDRAVAAVVAAAGTVAGGFLVNGRHLAFGDVSGLDFSERFETVDWSQARYADYGFVALDVRPAPHGTRTTMTLRFISQQGRELDRVVFSRTAGACLQA